MSSSSGNPHVFIQRKYFIMNKKQLALLLIGTLLASAAPSAETSPKNNASADPFATASSPKKAIKRWEPIAFDQNVDRLQPNYTGLDPKKFFHMYKSKVESLKKGDFETSEEFTKRTANLDALLSPIKTADTYAFVISNVFIKYDADTQAYLIESQYGDPCKETYSFGVFKDWVTCKVSAISRDYNSYVGSNAFGASRKVDRTHGLDFSLALAKDSAALSTSFKKGRYLTDQYSFQDRIPVPLEKARTLKDMKISVLFVGRISGAKIIEGQGILREPTIDSPIHIFIREEAIPFELNKIIYYVMRTGEILGQTTF